MYPAATTTATAATAPAAPSAAANTLVISETFAANETLSAADDSLEASISARNSFNATALITFDATLLSDNRSIEGNVLLFRAFKNLNWIQNVTLNGKNRYTKIVK